MATHRAQLLLSLLPNALAFGLSEIYPEPVPLKVHLSHPTSQPVRIAELGFRISTLMLL